MSIIAAAIHFSVCKLYCLYSEEDAVSVEEPEYEEEDGNVAEPDEEVVVITNVLFQAKEDGTAYALETYNVADNIGGDAIHSIDL